MTPYKPPANPSEEKFLVRFATVLSALGAFFAPLDFFHYYQQRNPIFLILGTINIICFSTSYYARRLAMNHKLAQAAIFMSYICLIPPPIFVCLLPAGRAALVLIPFCSLLLSLPYVDQKTIRRLAIVVFFIETWVGIVGVMLPDTSDMPPAMRLVMLGTSVPMAYLLIAVLIFHYGQRLNAALHQALTAVGARDEFIALASHELKTPLASLKLQVHLLLEDAQRAAISQDEKSEPIVMQITKTDRHVGRLNALVDAMLDVSRIRNGKFTLAPQTVNLTDIVRDALDRLRLGFQAAKCDIQFKGDAKVMGQWDRMRIEQVVTNLLTNAMKYGAGKPVEVTVGIEGNRALTCVRDYGIGIVKEDHARIFDRFERAVPANHYAGLGLGLYLTNQIVLAHGGRIEVESRPGQGAAFKVFLPL